MNKRGLVLFIVGLLTTTIRAFAQPSTSPLEWNSRGLTLSDFIVSEANSDRASNSSIQWLENTRLFRSSEMPWLKIKYSDIRNIFIPTESWIRVDARTPLKLKYEQLKFDLSEFYCRKVEREANLYGNLKSAMNNYRDSLATAARFFSELTLNGENERVVDSLRAIVSDQLSGIGMPYQDISIPEKKKFVLFPPYILPVFFPPGWDFPPAPQSGPIHGSRIISRVLPFRPFCRFIIPADWRLASKQRIIHIQ